MPSDPKKTKGYLNVKKLRAFLDSMESEWTEQDVKYLGKFEDLAILTIPSEKGYTYSKIEDATGYGGFFIVPANEKGEVLI